MENTNYQVMELILIAQLHIKGVTISFKSNQKSLEWALVWKNETERQHLWTHKSFKTPSHGADINHELLTFMLYVYEVISRKWKRRFLHENLFDSLFTRSKFTALKGLNGNVADVRVGDGGGTVGRSLVKPVIKGTPMPTHTPTPHPWWWLTPRWLITEGFPKFNHISTF